MRLVGLICAFLVVAFPLRAAPNPSGAAVIIGQSVRLRAGPGLNRPILSELPHGRLVEVVGRSSGWYRVDAGLTGWVAEPYLRLSLDGRVAAAGEARRLLELAQAMLGRGYTYGAAGPARFDCSGLVHYLYRQIGHQLPREAGAQMRAGIPVGRDELRSADLVFFTTNGRGTVSHVGVYLFDGEFIHASSGRGCVITSTMNDGYYQRNFVGAARVLSEN